MSNSLNFYIAIQEHLQDRVILGTAPNTQKIPVYNQTAPDNESVPYVVIGDMTNSIDVVSGVSTTTPIDEEELTLTITCYASDLILGYNIANKVAELLHGQESAINIDEATNISLLWREFQQHFLLEDNETRQVVSRYRAQVNSN